MTWYLGAQPVCFWMLYQNERLCTEKTSAHHPPGGNDAWLGLGINLCPKPMEWAFKRPWHWHQQQWLSDWEVLHFYAAYLKLLWIFSPDSNMIVKIKLYILLSLLTLALPLLFVQSEALRAIHAAICTQLILRFICQLIAAFWKDFVERKRFPWLLNLNGLFFACFPFQQCFQLWKCHFIEIIDNFFKKTEQRKKLKLVGGKRKGAEAFWRLHKTIVA